MAENRPAHKRTQVKQNGKQSQNFIGAARELGCEEDESHFEATLKKVARHKPPPDAPPEPKKPKTKKPGK
jgi:hypothetical protein